MNILQSSLVKACQQYKTHEKLLVCHSLTSGHQLLESLSKAGIPWLNVRPVTPYELALKAALSALQQSETTVAGEGRLLAILATILDDMATSQNLTYFAPLRQNTDLARILFPAICELRMAGCVSSELQPSMFVDTQKGHEIWMLLAGYEEKLAILKLADTASVFSLALQSTTETASLYLIPKELSFDYLTYTFLNYLTANNRLILAGEPVCGLTKPTGFYFITDTPQIESSMSYLHEPAKARPPTDTSLFTAYGATNEVREIIRRIHSSQTPIDKVTVCLADPSRYIPLFHSTGTRLSIPMTFADGLPLLFTGTGRFIQSLLRWIGEKYLSSILYRFLLSGDAEIPYAGTLARLLRQAAVGWNRDRYVTCLRALDHTLAQRAHSARQEGNNIQGEYYTKQRSHVQTLTDIITNILNHIPIPDEFNLLDFPTLCQGLSAILSTYTRTATETERAALSAIRETLAEESAACPRFIPVNDAIRRLREAVENLQIAASGPKPGHLHIAGLDSFDSRPVTFYAGLDANSFPGSGLQDPILLDEERQSISPNLSLKSAAPADKTYRLSQQLAARRGQLTLSFAIYDTVDGRPSSPASIVLQVYRLLCGNPAADYSDLIHSLGYPAAFASTPEQAISPDEWWLAAVLLGRYNHDTAVVSDCFPGIASGTLAEERREEAGFTEYDGRVNPTPDIDPRINQTLTLSATQLEKLASCPFSYFLRYILRIEPPDEPEFDPGAWLDAMARGSLLHDIYCRYLREAYPPNQPANPSKANLLRIASELIEQMKDTVPPPSQHIYEHERDEILREAYPPNQPANPSKANLLRIASELIEQMKDTVPPPSQHIYEHERDEILTSLDVFWQMEQQAKTIPAYFEVPFGFGKEEADAAKVGLADPVTIQLPSGGEIRFRGRIDRIDYGSNTHLYQVWDYKTGGTYGFDENKPYQQGRQIQHALYAFAAEAALRNVDDKAEVEVAGYIFPTEKGEGQRFARHSSLRQLVLEIVEKALDIVSSGLFCATDDKDRCTFCDYTIVCRHEETIVRAKLKKDDPYLKPWKELQDYE
ncbi:MAG: PD-(D/E)XK nuclease family protein [Clostridium sp.]|nr:PD-(D/E)XK nuclease family protein [Clostridium sp.]